MAMTKRTKIIELIRDIKNPAKDGRSRDWNKLPVIPAGSRFTVTEYRSSRGSLYASAQRYAHEDIDSTLAVAIIANSKEVAPETVTEFARVHDVDFGGDELLRILVKLGRVGAADFAAIAEVVNKDENF